MAELIPRSIFLHGNRQPAVTFFTSSQAKYFQAKTMFNSCGLDLSHRAHDDVPYREDYSGSPEDLLEGAIAQVRQRSGNSGYFFIEDTAIRIEALSGEVDTPGLAAKEWFAATSFEALSSQLNATHEWRCTVTSRIALAEPGRLRPVFFYGSVSGEIVRALPDTGGGLAHPWLDPSSFSGWFIPDGATRTLAEMSFEESIRYDFRGKSLLALLDHLEHVALALNAPPGSFWLRRHGRFADSQSDQPLLFTPTIPSATRRIVVAVGPPCSGKTTLGLQVAKDFGFRFCDASSLVKAEMIETPLGGPDIGAYSIQLLQDKGPDYIARQVSDSIIVDDEESYVITGFRLIEEIRLFRERYPDVVVISLTSSRRARHDRYLARASRTTRSYDDFRKIDEQQATMGLLKVADLLSDYRIRNVGSLAGFIDQVRATISHVRDDSNPAERALARKYELSTNQLYRCLLVLRDAGGPLTTQELEARFTQSPIRYNNANKILKRYPELVARHEGRGDNVRYSISVKGLAFIAAVGQLLESPG